MKKVKFLLVAIFCVSMMMLALNASANIYVNEDFESGAEYRVGTGATSIGLNGFVDQNWVDNATTITPFGDPLLVMGKMIKNGQTGAAPTTMSMTKNQGSNLTTETFFRGTHCSKLIGDDPLTGTSNTLSFLANPQNMVPNAWVSNANFRIWQFAVRTDAATVDKAAGTQIGHFRIAFSTDGTTAKAPNASLGLLFFTNTKKTIDVFCSTTLTRDAKTKVGEFGGSGPRAWSVVTIVENQGDAARWICYDKALNFKGPQPLVAKPNFDTITDSDWYFMPKGYSIFINRNEQSLILTPTDGLNAKWGNGTNQSSPMDFGWEMQAERGGVLYVDQMFWGNSRQDNNGDGLANEIGNRLLGFTARSQEGLSAAAGPSWMLY